ncbi:hypothetical protein [Nitrosomonas sp. wSCUT-2]
MSQKTGRAIKAAEPTQKTTSFSEEERCEGEVEKDLTDASHQADSAPQGTPSCNTVPSNDNPKHFKPLLYGIDSLYLSYYGQLSEDWDSKLSKLKEKAQSEDEKVQALAQVAIGSHLFEVSYRGFPRFPYVLSDNCFFIKLNRSQSSKLPMAHVQVYSEYLAAVGAEAAEKDLRFVVNTLGLVPDAPGVSRADLFLDFVCIDNLSEIHHSDWITRANLMAKYFDCRLDDPFTGWVIGIGGDLHARLYEKVIEIKTKSHKTWLFSLWESNGWQADEKVWRIEFQAEKQLLKQLGIIGLSELQCNQAALWHYFTHDWLRLSTPSLTDSKRNRWPNHPLWDDISNIYTLPSDQPRLKRFSIGRLPHDERIFVHGLGGLTSFMAREGIEDFSEGVGEYLHHATQYHARKNENLQRYIQRKVKVKGRKYNTINNCENLAETIQGRKQRAKAYQSAKDGE